MFLINMVIIAMNIVTMAVKIATLVVNSETNIKMGKIPVTNVPPAYPRNPGSETCRLLTQGILGQRHATCPPKESWVRDVPPAHPKNLGSEETIFKDDLTKCCLQPYLL